MSIQDITALAIAIAAIATALVTLFTLKDARKNSFADIHFRLDEAFLKKENVRKLLAPGGDWHRRKNDPDYPKGPNYTLAEEATAITSYMGLFERIWELIERKIITINDFDGWYGDRLLNIVLNVKIQKRICDHKEGWSDFITLWTALEEHREKDPKRAFPEEARVHNVLKCLQVPVNMRGMEVSSQLDSPAQPEVVEAQ